MITKNVINRHFASIADTDNILEDKMKKLISVLLTLVLLFSLCACGEEAPESDPEQGGKVNTEASGNPYVFSYNGAKIALKSDPSVLDALGDPISTASEASCAFEGEDITYFYSNFEVLVAAPAKGDRYISSVVLKSDAVATAEGLEIGMPQSKVTDIYGECNFDDPLYVYTRDGSQLRIKITDGAVSGIEYVIPA